MTPAAAALSACRFVAERVRASEGRRWLEGLRVPPLPCHSSIPEVRLFAERRLRAVPAPAARALVSWADGQRPVDLFHYVPTARAVLALAARGRRCVSLLHDRSGPDGLAFALHDLCHLEKFVDAQHYAGQVGFFARLQRALENPGWSALEAGFDAEWASERDHVLADMNASPIFLWCGLRSRVRKACHRAGLPFAPRLEHLLDLLALRGSVRADATMVASRHAPRAASLRLAGFFAEVGTAQLQWLRCVGLYTL